MDRVNEATKKTCLSKIALHVLPLREISLIAVTSITSHIDLKQVFDRAPQTARIFHSLGKKNSMPHQRGGNFLLYHKLRYHVHDNPNLELR